MNKEVYSPPSAPSWTWASASEVVAGHMMAGRIVDVDPEKLCPPYDRVVKHYSTRPTQEQWMAALGPLYYHQATEAAKATASIAVDWVSVLYKAWQDEALAREFERQMRNIRDGRSWSLDTINRICSANTESFWVSLDQVPDTRTPFFRTGFKPIDTHSGGVPDTLTIIAGGPGEGKTWLAQAIARSVAERTLAADDPVHGKFVFFISREMPAEDLKIRLKASGTPPDILARIKVDDRPLSLDEALMEISKLVGQAAIVVVDFLDYFVAGGGEQEYARAYRMFADAQQKAECPLILLAQTTRAGAAGIPRKHHLRYSRLAESFGANIYLIVNPHTTAYPPEVLSVLPRKPGRAYVVQDKARYGTAHVGHSVGVIEATWYPDSGWVNDDTATWLGAVSAPPPPKQKEVPDDVYSR